MIFVYIKYMYIIFVFVILNNYFAQICQSNVIRVPSISHDQSRIRGKSTTGKINNGDDLRLFRSS